MFAPNNFIHYYAHNNFVEILADLGLVGFFLYYWKVFKCTAWLALKKMEINDISLLSLAILINLIVGDYSTVSYFDDCLQIYLSTAFAIYYFYKANRKEKENEV